MCIKLTRTLNPKAKEWKPNSTTQTPQQLLPHVIIPPHSAAVPEQPPMQTAAMYTATTTPPHKIIPIYNQHPYYYYYGNNYSNWGFIPYDALAQPLYYHHHHPTVASQTVENGSCWLLREEKAVERPISPPAAVAKKGSRRVIPPRLQRAKRSFSIDQRPATLLRQEWRPKNPNYKVSSGRAAVFPPPPPPSADKSAAWLNMTTVMIKNIPNQLRRDFMLEFLDGYCREYSMEYDFFYLPMDFRKGDNLGYAFVNFTTSLSAKRFKDILQNYSWKMMNTDKGPIVSKKICEITWARIQGIEALIKRFNNSTFACDKLDFLPVVLDPPRNGSDPNPAPPVIIGSLNHSAFTKIY